MQAMYTSGIYLSQHARQEVRLLLVVPFETDAIARFQERFHRVHHFFRTKKSPVAILGHACHASFFAQPARRPSFFGNLQLVRYTCTHMPCADTSSRSSSMADVRVGVSLRTGAGATPQLGRGLPLVSVLKGISRSPIPNATAV